MDLTTVLVFVVVFLVSYFLYTRPKNLPPGPLGLPVLGSFFLVNQFRHERPHKVLFEASKKYGNVMSFRLGKRLFVVLTGYDAVHEALVKQADIFSDRPKVNPLDKGTPNAKELQDTPEFLQKLRNGGIIFQHHGSTWRMLRRFTLQTLRDFGVGKTSLEDKIFTELDVVSKHLQDSDGSPVHTSSYTQKLVGNVMLGIVFGKRYDYDDPEFDRIRAILNNLVSGTGAFSATNLLPKFLAKLVSKKDTNNDAGRLQSIRGVRKYVADEIREHEATFDNDNIRDFVDIYLQTKHETNGAKEEIDDEIREHEATFDNDNIRDFVDIYLQTKHETNGAKEEIDEGNMFRVIMDLFLAGMETTYTTLDWAFLYMSEFPDIQAKCQQEIKEVFGDKQIQYSTDRGKLLYLEATLLEIQRVSMIAPLAVLHCNTKDATLYGYTIPKGTTIMPSLYSATHDPKYWTQPDKFWPERFLTEDGKLVKNEAFIPFSTGPRVCLGEPLAKMELFLVFTTLLQRFTFHREKEGVPHSLEPKQYNLTNKPTSYNLRVYKRK